MLFLEPTYMKIIVGWLKRSGANKMILHEKTVGWLKRSGANKMIYTEEK